MNKKQKTILSLLSLVTIGLLCSTFYFTYYTKKNKDYQAFANELIAKESKQRQGQPLNMLKDPKRKYNNLAFIPKEQSKTDTAALFNLVSSENDAFSKKLKLKKKDFIMTDIQLKKTDLNVNYISVKETAFKWEKNKFIKNDSVDSKHFLSKDTYQPLTLKQLFESPDRLKKFELILKQKMLDQSSKSDKAVDAILNLKPLSFKDNNVKITPEGVSYSFDKKKYFVDTVQVPFEELTHTLSDKVLAKDKKHPAPKEKKKKRVALTFDDGPGPESTSKLLDILKKENTPATFFMLGRSALNFPEAAKKVADAGHTIASHSYTHELLTAESPDEIRQQDLKADKAIYQATGVLPKVFRPPYGGVDKTVSDIIEKPMIQWDVDTMDWQLKDADAIIKQTMTYVQDGSIILVHDIHQESVDAIPGMIEALKAKNFEIVTLDELSEADLLPDSQYFSAHDSREIKAKEDKEDLSDL